MCREPAIIEVLSAFVENKDHWSRKNSKKAFGEYVTTLDYTLTFLLLQLILPYSQKMYHFM
jgi:hypothetical protein